MPNSQREAPIQLNHIALVVEDLQGALAFWRDGLGLTVEGEIQSVPEEAVAIVKIAVGDSHIELISPSTAGSGVAKYLGKRGPGLHHICLEVADLNAKLRQLQALGCELINETPRERAGWRYAFIHPKSSGGCLLELYERL